MTIKFASILMGGSALALAACAPKAPESLPPPPETSSTPSATPTPSGPAALVPGTQGHFESIMMGSDTIYFDTDKFNIDSGDMDALRQQAEYLLRYPSVSATIEGHCDERGTRDYNLALGERRANSAKNYLISLGVPAGRLATVSHGKERPKALGSNEGAWAQNRRAATLVLN